MCYNIDCNIEIASKIDGEKSIVKTNGKVIGTPFGYRFEYKLNNDKCMLSVTDSEIVQERQGEQNIKLTFRKGEQTRGLLASGGFSGAFPIYTEHFEYVVNSVEGEVDGRIFNLSIVYTLGEQKTEIIFSAKYTSKGKI